MFVSLRTSPLLVSSALCALGLVTFAQDGKGYTWPQWDGPDHNGVSRETDWVSEGKAESLFEVEVGLGYSTVSVVGDRLYTMGYDKDAGLDMVFCLDAVSGEEIWVHSYPSKIWNRAHEGGTVNTPSIGEDAVFTLNREGNLFRLDAATGEVEWHTPLVPEANPHDLKIPTWGYSGSPLLVDGDMYLNCGRLLSIDKKSGEVLWASKDYGDGYGTPLALEVNGKKALAVLNGDGVAVVDRASGDELYFYPFTGERRGVNASTPIAIDDAMFVSSGKIPAGALLAFDEKELIPVWENREMATSFSGCVRIGDYLYGYDQTILKCVDLEGQPHWAERGIGNGAVLGAGDRVLAMGATGELIVFEATPEKFNELSRVKLFEAGNFWTKPVLVNGIVYCRSSKGVLVARDHRPE